MITENQYCVRLLIARFTKVAELVSVCWFNVHGCINSSALSANTRYAAYLVFKLAHNARGLNSLRQRSFVEVGRHRVCIHTASLHPCKRTSCCSDGDVRSTATTTTEPHEHEEEGAGCVVRYPRPRMDGWMELEMGEFYIEGDTVGNVDMILQELEELHWKTGLIIEGIEIRPKN